MNSIQTKSVEKTGKKDTCLVVQLFVRYRHLIEYIEIYGHLKNTYKNMSR